VLDGRELLAITLHRSDRTGVIVDRSDADVAPRRGPALASAFVDPIGGDRVVGDSWRANPTI
jgi:hypothetical protein